ncbi:hypothetical protein A0H81_13851 [Grifola frondosa]|uniref:Uncharacterized protein n=1 Tax=Grifola frondosa TaxID=5627 RepID=A0A1C7LQ07_GRIFR|nr:hypothetical protein A0H81_13851 [Grifola frondosa]
MLVTILGCRTVLVTAGSSAAQGYFNSSFLPAGLGYLLAHLVDFRRMYLYERSDSSITGDQQHAELKVFLTFQFLGGAGLLAVLLTAIFDPKIYRHFTWLNFCITWIIYSISYTLLAFTGKQTSPEPPAYPLCLAQASLIYAAPVLVASSTFALVLQLWFTLSSALSPPVKGNDRGGRYWIRNALLLVLPYVAWFAVVIAILVVGSTHPDTVRRAGGLVYCVINTGTPGNIVAIFVAAVMFVMIIFDIYIGVVLYRNWRALRVSSVSLLLAARSSSLSAVSYFAGNTIIALMPFIAFLVFGTQRDILRVWTFQRR